MPTETKDEKVGARLREARRILNQTQGELAKILNVTQALLSNLERGKNTLSYKHAEKLEESLGINKYWLLEGRGSPLEKPTKPFFPKALKGVLLPDFSDVTDTFKVATDSMEPDLFRGDLCLCEKLDPENLEDLQVGKIYYIVSNKYRQFRKLVSARNYKLTLEAGSTGVANVEVLFKDVEQIFQVLHSVRSYR